MNDSIRQGAGRPVTLAEALHILKCVHTLSPAEQRDIDEAIRCIVAFDGITDEMVEQALAAANGAMVDTRRYWTDSDKAAVRAMLEAVIEAVPPRSTRPEAATKNRMIELSPEFAQSILDQLGLFAFRCKMEVDRDRERGIPDEHNGAKLGTVVRLEEVSAAWNGLREAITPRSPLAPTEKNRD